MRIILFICFFIFSFDVFSQEFTYPLMCNKNINNVNIEQRSNYVSALPFFDDFTSFSKSSNLWLDYNVYFNNTLCIQPLNYGVATFDGLDSLGNPYNNSVVNLSGIADNLTSVKINLQGLTDVYFSFYYQKKGRGDDPESQDSLNLYFKKDSIWCNVWNITPDSCNSDSLFFKVSILIPDSLCGSEFQFKFSNYASLNGAFDNWHIDNVLVSDDFNLHQYQDIAFSEPPSSLIFNYSSVPWSHYLQLPKTFIDSFVIDVSLYNNYGVCKNKDYKFDIFDHLGNHIDHYYKGDPPDINDFNSPRQVDFVNGFSFIGENIDPLCSTPAIDISDGVYSIFKDSAYVNYPTFDIRHIIFANDIDSIFSNNDTILLKQKFRDWYSYDDGTAEASYGLNVSGGQIAYKFENIISDTIYAVDIYFDHNIEDLSSSEFQILIFDDNNSYPGNIIFQSTQIYTPEINSYSHGFYRFFLEEGVYVENNFYVGFLQFNSNIINLGLDRNNINNDKMFFNVGGGWLNSACNGCLGSWMIRPVFSQDNLLSNDFNKKVDFEIYPNPSKGIFYFSFDDDYIFEKLEIRDLLGNIVYSCETSNSLDLSFLSSGVYIVFLFEKNNIISSEKIIIQK